LFDEKTIKSTSEPTPAYIAAEALCKPSLTFKSPRKAAQDAKVLEVEELF